MIRLSAHARRDAEVIVVGGGPAGASCAFHLAARGVDVLLLDKATFPRDKVCGDFVGPVAITELAPMGVVEAATAAASNVVRRAGVFLDGEHVVTRPLPHKAGHPDHGLVIPRTVLDHWILEAAARCGARVAEDAAVVGFEATGDHVEVVVEPAAAGGSRRTLRAGLVIGADGSNSTIGNQLRGPVPRRDRILAVRAYFAATAGPPDRADLLFHTTTFPGYTWVFPTGPDTANVGVGVASESFPRSTVHLRPMLEDLMASDPALRRRIGATARMVGRIKGFPLSTYNPGMAITGPRVLLVGDAAGLINPINGEGIQYALSSGRWAAEVVAEARRTDFSRDSLARYASRVRAELGSDLAFARLIVHTISNRDLNPVWLGVLRIILDRADHSAAFADLAGGILAGIEPTTRALGMSMMASLAAAASGGARSVVGAFRDHPVDLTVGAGLSAAGMGFRLAHDVVNDGARMREWAAAVARSGIATGRALAGDGVRAAAPRLWHDARRDGLQREVEH